MKVSAISDTHTRSFKIPTGTELFVHAGDMLARGDREELLQFARLLSSQRPNYDYALLVPGNHDGIFEKNLPLAKSIIGDLATILIDDEVTIAGKRIYGSPYTPTFCNWYFMKDRGAEIRKVWDLIPENLDLLVTHGPPQGILDIPGAPHPQEHLGCWDLKDVIDKLTSPPKHAIFGHIHRDLDATMIYPTRQTIFYNVALCDEQYMPVRECTRFDI